MQQQQQLRTMFILVTTVVLQYVAKSSGQHVIERPVCTESQYLDTTNFQCYQCSDPPNAPIEASLQEGLQARIPDPSTKIKPYPDSDYTVATGCKCKPGWIVNEAQYTTSESCNLQLAVRNFWCEATTCIQCPEASSLDNSVCQTCGEVGDTTITFDSTTGRCVCVDPTHRLQEKNDLGEYLTAKTCVPCPLNTLLRKSYLEKLIEDLGSSSSDIPTATEADSYICQACPHPEMTIENDRCVCAPSGIQNPQWTTVGSSQSISGTACVLSQEISEVNENNFREITYHQVVASESTSAGQRLLKSLRGGFSALLPVDEKDDEYQGNQLHQHTRSSNIENPGQRRVMAQRRLFNEDVSYNSFTVTRSYLLERYYQVAGAKCRYLRDEVGLAACQTLASLCVMQHYDDQTPACALYDEIQRNRPSWLKFDLDWRETMPWIRYNIAARTIVKDLSVELTMSFDMEKKAGTYDYLQFVLARFAINGTFLGWSQVTTEFEYCTPTLNKIPTWTKFGNGHSTTYPCNLLNIMDQFPEPVLYDMYLVDHGAGGKLFPIPVRNVNLRSSGRYPNDNDVFTKAEDDQLTRRFFLYDQVSSKESIRGKPKVIRYAKDIHLTIQIQESSPNRIHPPVLEIFYEERLVSDFFTQGVDVNGVPPESATTVSVSFTVEYTEDYDSFWTSATSFFGIFMTVYALGVMLRLYNFSRRNTRLSGGDNALDLGFLLRVLLHGLSTFAQVMFWFLFVYAEYIFVFFKMQDNIHLLLPVDRPTFGNDNDYYPFEFLLVAIFLGQCCRMTEILYEQTTCDVFFSDWEKPRGRVASKRGDGTKSKFAPVSIWRTLFMTNEWNEMQRVRKYNVSFSFLALALLLIGYDLQYLATPQPNYQDLSPGALNKLLRFANTSFWFLVVTYSQILWKWAIQDRYFTEPPPQSFIDLCTIAKVSMFIIDEEYHGYYLHCRSQHEYSDGNMLEISRQLRQEAEGLTTDRGLPGGPPSVQTYEMYVSGDWRKQYNFIFRSMMSQELNYQHADTSSFLMRVFGCGSKRAPAEKLVRASRKLNAFLRAFVDQTTSEFPIQHREQTFIHRFLHIPPDMVSSKETLFYADTNFAFTKVFFYGQTWNLVLFNLVCIGMYDYVWDNTMLSIFLAYLTDQLVTVLRVAFGNANLAAKTLVDDRFLL